MDLAPALEALGSCKLVVLSDVDNPLVGKRGALRMYGAQKGLLSGDDYVGDEAETERLLAVYDSWMVAYGRALDEARIQLDYSDEHEASPRFRSVLGVPGGGAAGGLGAALLALGARMTSGTNAMLDLIGFDEALADADLLITGEGFMDEQTAHGKAPAGAASRAKKRGSAHYSRWWEGVRTISMTCTLPVSTLCCPSCESPCRLRRRSILTRRRQTSVPPVRLPCTHIF